MSRRPRQKVALDDQESRWEPFQRAVNKHGQHVIDTAGERYRMFMNNLYTVMVREVEPLVENWPPMIHLSIRRNDRQPIMDWRHLQRIKNELAGPEHEAVQLFPAESRLLDTSNQYHLWVLPRPGMKFPFGYLERLVSDVSSHGAVQRPFPEGWRPDDCMDAEKIHKAMEEYQGRCANAVGEVE